MHDFWNWITKDSISFFTFVLALFTLALVVASFWQGLVTHRSLQLATNEFRATHRPKITVRSFQTLSDGESAESSITFLYVNTGELPAKVIAIDHCLGFGSVERAQPTFVRDKIESVVLESGDKEIFEIKAPTTLLFNSAYSKVAENQGRPIGGRDAYIIGNVIYEDTRGRRRETGFCRVSAGSRDPWVTPKGSEYEYQD